MTYKENVRKVSEEMANEASIKTGIPHWIPDYEAAAVVSLHREAEAVRAAIRIGFNPTFSESTLNAYLIEKGLIPAPEALTCGKCQPVIFWYNKVDVVKEKQ